MSKRTLTALIALAGIASGANAAAVGNIVFTSKTNDAVMYYNNGVTSTLVSFADPDVRLAEVFRAPTGDWYVDSGPFPVDTSNNKSALYKIDNVFAAVPVVSTVKQGFDMANPEGMVWYNGQNNILYANNAQSEYGNDSAVHRGVRSVNVTSGVDVNSYQQTFISTPTVRTANDILQNPYGGNDDFYLVAINGGNVDFSSADAAWSTLWHYSVDSGTKAGTPSLMVNLGDTSATGLAKPLTFVRHATIKTASNEMFVVNAALDIQDQSMNGIFKITLNPDGTFGGISMIFQDLVNALRPDNVEYNPFTDKVVFSDEPTGAIYQINPDGSGFELVVAGVGSRGFYFVPAPGAAALVGLAGLAALRRRR
ncbi:MAG: hypothetical protein IT435_19575 [Phycisphaerales bacterium]|nr:hypothetical protein [Phycisphaerales bacterium]